LYNLNYTILNDGDSVRVRLITTSLFGCKNDTAQQLFYTITSPVARFAVVPDSGCSPLTVAVYDSSSAGVSLSWYLNDSLFSTASNPVLSLINHSSTHDSVVTLKLVITAGTGCQDSTEQDITLFPKPVADFAIVASSCPGDTIGVSNTSSAKGATYQWFINSAAVTISNDTIAQPSFIFKDRQSGFDSTYTITLWVTSADGCTDTTAQNITIFSRPVAGFSLPAAACAPLAINPVDSSTGKALNYTWTINPPVPSTGLNSSNPQFNFPASFNDSVVYTINLTVVDSNGCMDSASSTYTVYPRPAAGFTSTLLDSCSPFSIQFTNTSATNQSGMNRNSMTFWWDAGNGQTSADSTPVFTYTNTGVVDSTYIVTLIATNAFGCSDTLIDTVVVHPNPRAVITATRTASCAPFVIDSSLVNATNFIVANQQYYWQIVSTAGLVLSQDTGLYNLNHVITNSADTVLIRLIASSPYGCKSDTATQLFYTIPNPIANFSVVPDSGCSPLVVNVLDSASPGATRHWYFNNVYQFSGPTTQFTFTNTSQTLDSTIVIKLVVEAGTGCKDSIEKAVVVHPSPLASFNIVTAACPQDTLTAQNTSATQSGSIYMWSTNAHQAWISNSSALSPQIVFANNQSGTDSIYRITLVVVSPNGCSDTTFQDVTIPARPLAAFGLPAAACSPQVISPANLSSGNNLLYQWISIPAVPTTGANSSSPGFSFPLTTNDSVVYTIKLTITDSVTGCQDSIALPYTVYPKPQAGFSVSTKDSCSPFTIDFVNTSSPNQSGMNRSSMTFMWDFNNGTTSTDSVPTATFTNSGTQDTTYYITLIATNAFGCSDTIRDSIVVHPDPRAVITATRSANCAPFVIDSSVVSATAFTAANQQYYWQLLSTNGTILSQDTGISRLNYTITTPADSVILRLIASSPFGCKSDTATQLMFTIPNPIARFTPVPDSGCSPLLVNIIDSASPGANRHWYVNGVFHSSGAAPVFTFVNNSLTADSIITIKLVVEAGTGCKDSTEQSVTLFPEPIADFSMAANRCPWDTIFVTNNSLGKAGASYLWSTSSPTAWISNNTAAQPQIVFGNNQSGADSTYQVTLILTSVDGCTDTITRSITIYTRPIADFTLPAAACSPVRVNPTDNSTGSSLSYMWSSTPAINITGDTTANPVFDFPLSTSDSVVYTIKLVVVDMVKGCVDSISKNYTVYPKPQAGFTVSSKDSCGPFTLDFVNTSLPNQSGMNRQDMTFFWDFHNGQTSTDSVPTVTFTNAGLKDTTYAITLIATNAFGCSDTLIDSITVHPNPKATITLVTQADCAPWLIDSNVVGNIHYPAANTSYVWEILDAKTRNVLATYNSAATINHLLAQPGDSIIVRLTAVSIFNCKSDTIENLIYTIGKSFPGFSASVYEGCGPLTVNFTDTVPGFTAWEWYANGVLFSNLANPTKTFTNTSFTQDSIYEIKMVPYSGYGCKDSVIQHITVYARPDVQWTAANSCLNDSVVFVNQTASIHPIVGWSWNFGDGQSDTSRHPLHRYAAPGRYTVSLTATNDKGCVNVSYDTITVYPRPVANFNMSSACGTDTACINQSFSLTDASTLFSLGGSITQWQWDIDADGTVEYTTQNPIHTFNGTGTFPIRLIVTSQFGCSDTIEKSFYISEAPTAYFNIDSIRRCGPFTTSVTDSSYGLIDTYQWQVYVLNRQGVPTVIYSTNQRNPNPLPTFWPNYGADTTYYISQTVGNCCGSTTYLDSIVLKSMPVPRMLPSSYSGCTPFTATFQLDGLVKGRPDYLVMNYGDGVIDTLNRFYQITPTNDTIWVWGQQNHTFVNNGVHDTTYTVYLTAANDCGDSTISLNITVHPKNVQAFIGATPEQGCAPLTVTITDKSYGGINTTWCLDYNPITGVCNQPTALGDSIIYTYTTPGTYVIAQYVSDACSADTAYKTITVYPSPTADFNHSGSTCEDNAVVFTNLSNTSSTSITGYTWDFGDGTGTFLANPTHYYQNPGTYNVTLTVMSVNGCMDSITKAVTIYSKPEISFSVPNACLNRQPIAFFDSSSTQTGQIISTIWKFGDGNTSVMPNPTHTYAAPGMYTVTLIHSTNLGCTDSTRRVVNIFPISTAEFTTTNSLGKKCGAPQQINFINQSSSAAGYYWDFDFNGNRGTSTSTLVNPSFIYTKDGAYNVLLVAYNANGCVDSIIKPVFIRPFPKAGFEGDVFEGCAPLTVNFTDTSIYNFNGPGRIVSWTWDFGDGNFSSGMPNVTHTYTEPGSYTVSLRVESDGGCSDTVQYFNYIVVNPTPVAGFTYAEINSKTFNFVNTSQYTDKNTNYYWTFGDGKHSREKSPKHIYNVDLFETDYIFEVCLYTSNEFGCGDTLCQEINLKGYLLFTPNAFAPGVEGAGDANYFLPAGHSMEKYRLQIFDEWGNVIFESTSLDENGVPNEPWYGKHAKKGTELPMGAYVWKIDAVFNDGTIWEGKDYGKNVRKPYGTVTLIR
jgi:PKD repeat protein